MSRWLAGLREAYHAHPIPAVVVAALIALAIGFGIGDAIISYAFPDTGVPAPRASVSFGTSQSAQSEAPVTPSNTIRSEPATYTVPAPIEGTPTSNAPRTSLSAPTGRPPTGTSPASVSPSPSATVSLSASPAPSPSPSPSPDPTPDPEPDTIGGSS
jgi:hypothetical protein